MDCHKYFRRLQAKIVKLEEKQRSTGNLLKPNPRETDEFIDILNSQLEKLKRQNVALSENNKTLLAQLEKSKAMELHHYREKKRLLDISKRPPSPSKVVVPTAVPITIKPAPTPKQYIKKK